MTSDCVSNGIDDKREAIIKFQVVNVTSNFEGKSSSPLSYENSFDFL